MAKKKAGGSSSKAAAKAAKKAKAVQKVERKEGKKEAVTEVIVSQSWTSFLGDERWVNILVSGNMRGVR